MIRRRQLRDNDITDPEIFDILDGPPPVIRSERDFRPYQKYMSDLACKKPAVLLAASMGLGKTGAVLHALRRMLDKGVIKKVLVVAPLYVARNTWPEEMRVWTFARRLSYSVLTGEESERRKAAMQPTQIHIINRENLVWLGALHGGRWPYDCLVYDEASRLKGGRKRTGVTKRADGSVSGRKLSEFGALARSRGYYKKVIELSGTPAPNGLVDLWGPAYILDQGRRLGATKTAFMDRWFKVDPYNWSVTPHPHSQAEIMSRLSDVMVSLREEDYLSLPPLVVRDRWVTMPPHLDDQYERFEKTMVLEEYDIEAVSSGVLVNKLLQFANGGLYRQDGTVQPVHDLKLKALESVVEEAGGAPILIAYSFKFDLARIRKKFPKFRVFGESRDDLRDWNAGRIPGLIVHPASAGHGLNFQHGSNICVWYGLNWSLELYKQFNKRLHRSGQKADRVYMYRILCRHTVDEQMLGVLEHKGATQDSITEMVRVRAERLLKT
jgi:hypothetical protein